MPGKRGRPKKVKPELQLKSVPVEINAPRELNDFIIEANEVKQLTSMRGWEIIKRDLAGYKEGIMQKLAYINPRRMEYNELRLLYLSANKIISLVEDYQVNKEKSVEYLNKLQNLDLAVTFDIDNE